MSNDPYSGATHRSATDRRFVSQLTRNTFAMTLEGARGSQLHELTDWRSKPAVAFGGKFRIIDFVLSNCVNSGMRRVGVAAQYRAQNLIRHLQLDWSFLDGRLGEFIEIMPAQQQVSESQWCRGRADAVYQNLREIRRAAPHQVLVLSGDHEDSVVLSNAEIGMNCVLRRCIIDKNCSIPAGMVIGCDPVQDGRRFHVSEGGVTLVTRVMLGQEQRLL